MEAQASDEPLPRTIEALRELALKIGRDESELSLGAKAHDVLARLVGMPEQAAVRSISELAGLLSVNASTLTRLAKRLGYAGLAISKACSGRPSPTISAISTVARSADC